MFSETPPVKVISSSTPTRRTSDMVRVAMALWTPPRISSTVFRWARYDMMSDSTNTVQTEVSRTGVFARSDNGPISSSPTPVTSAAAERKRPVPAAHLSFIEKSTTEPSAPTLMALVSWPPMSMTVRVAGNSDWAPRPWQVISVICASPKVTL